jgi:hypothetical protein
VEKNRHAIRYTRKYNNGVVGALAAGRKRLDICPQSLSDQEYRREVEGIGGRHGDRTILEVDEALGSSLGGPPRVVGQPRHLQRRGE